MNRYRPQLEAQAGLTLGRTVKLGDLSLSILSGKIVANNIEIADDLAFSQSPFLKAQSVEIDVELMPLIFSRKLNVTGVVIERPQIFLLKNSDGIFNFSSLGSVSHTSHPASHPNHPPLSVARFIVNHGRLTAARLNSSRQPRVYDDFSIEVTDFSRTTQFHFKLLTQLPGGGDAALSGKAGPIFFKNVAATPFEASVKINSMHISSYGFIDPASGISGIVNMDGTLISDGSTSIARGTVTGLAMTFAPRGAPCPELIKIENTVEVNLNTDSAKITQSDISIGKAQFHMTGIVESRDEESIVNLELIGKSVPIDDLQAVLPSVAFRLPLGSHLQGGTLSINFTVAGPLISPTVSGPVHMADTKLVGYNLGSQIGTLASFAGRAVSQPDTSVHSLFFYAKGTLAGLAVSNIRADLPGVGTATGAGTISPDGTLHFATLVYPSSGIAGGVTKIASVGSGNGRVPVAITGTVTHPVIDPSTVAAARIMVVQTAKGIVSVPIHVIGRLFGKKNNENKSAK